jgi:hypothetical protein
VIKPGKTGRQGGAPLHEEGQIMSDITCIRVPVQEKTDTYAAVRGTEVADLLDDQPPGSEAVVLDLPAEIAAMITAQLAGPVRRAVVIVGTIDCGIWVSGPLQGQVMPDLRPLGLRKIPPPETTKRCTEYTRQGDLCRNPATRGSDTCATHKPAPDPEHTPRTAW